MIVLEKIGKVYKGTGCEYPALHEVSLKIEEGEMVAIMGASGSGKTTLLNIIGGMDRQTSGAYFCDGIEVSALNDGQLHKFRKEHVSFIFQHFELIDYYTVYENVEIPLLARNMPRKKRRESIMNSLEEMGIADLANKMPNAISGGQQQRAAIARALVMENKLLLADEPSGALDSTTAAEILDIFERLHKAGKTVIIVTHDRNVANRCGRIIKIQDGRIVQ